MGHENHALKRKIRALRRTRDQLQVNLHLGHMDAREIWGDLEKRWNRLQANAKHLGRESEDSLGRVANMVRDNITELRDGYDHLASTLRETKPDSSRGQFRNTFDRFVEEGHRATERVVGCFEELAGAAELRMEKARLERRLTKKCAELGTQVYELAKESGLPDGGPPDVLHDDKVRALLQEVGSLDADLQKTAAELLDPDRSGA